MPSELQGFQGARLFLDSVEQAITATLVDAYAGQSRSAQPLRGGLGPARLRGITELVHAKMEDELTLIEMAQSVELSPGHFSRMFRKSTGEPPHQFVLRNRIERAKEMLRAPEARVLDVALACGFKTQQHFARIFRRMCGASPTEYRYAVLALKVGAHWPRLIGAAHSDTGIEPRKDESWANRQSRSNRGALTSRLG